MIIQSQQETKLDTLKKLRKFLKSLPIEVSFSYDKYTSEVSVSTNVDKKQYTFYMAKSTSPKKFVENVKDTLEIYLPIIERSVHKIVKRTPEEIALSLENGEDDIQSYKEISIYSRFRMIRQQKNFRVCYIRNLNNGEVEKFIFDRDTADCIRNSVLENNIDNIHKYFIEKNISSKL